ncbi:MAG TPA: hypothetical protein VFG74_07055 [Miltoncostaeaceae bacterium]|nr:hypothetical protein [Miltoncostaeaceae bacterium]
MADQASPDQASDQGSPDQGSGIDLMRRRIERASRQPPPSRRPRGDAPAAEATPATAAAPAPAAEAPATPAPRPRRTRTAPEAGERRLRLAPDLPPVNLAIRVRKPLDDGLADAIHALRRDGVRTSKVEVIEMLLWESAGATPQALRERLRTFREWAPRGPGARLDA